MAKFWAAGEGLRLKRALFWCWLSLFFIVPRAGCCESHRAALASSHTASREVASLQIRTSFFSLLAAGAQLATTRRFVVDFFLAEKNFITAQSIFALWAERVGCCRVETPFSICTLRCFGLAGEQGFQNNGDQSFFFFQHAGKQPQKNYSSSCKYQQHQSSSSQPFLTTFSCEYNFTLNACTFRA